MTKNNKRLQISLSPEIVEKLEKMAKTLGITKAAVIAVACDQYFKANDKK